ncbi:MAG: lipid II flippase MurJ, partial [Lentisphaeria bacterium]|nr:lipid II flippase MurJ [Lentisphaeria bacterium]
MPDPARENGAQEPAAPPDNGSTRLIGRGMLVGGTGTLLSRLTGLARDIAYGAVFGTTGAYSMFLAVFTIPNLFRRVFGEGALSEAFVPLFNEKLERHGKSAAFAFFSNVLLLTAAVLLRRGRFAPPPPALPPLLLLLLLFLLLLLLLLRVLLMRLL